MVVMRYMRVGVKLVAVLRTVRRVSRYCDGISPSGVQSRTVELRFRHQVSRVVENIARGAMSKAYYDTVRPFLPKRHVAYTSNDNIHQVH